jgi:hypothetical protein
MTALLQHLFLFCDLLPSDLGARLRRRRHRRHGPQRAAVLGAPAHPELLHVPLRSVGSGRIASSEIEVPVLVLNLYEVDARQHKATTRLNPTSMRASDCRHHMAGAPQSANTTWRCTESPAAPDQPRPLSARVALSCAASRCAAAHRAGRAVDLAHGTQSALATHM